MAEPLSFFGRDRNLLSAARSAERLFAQECEPDPGKASQE